MSVPGNETPKNNLLNDKKKSETQQNELSNFLDLISKNNARLIPVMRGIGNDSMESAAISFSKLLLYQEETLGVLLGQALESKIFQEEQITSFFDSLFKLYPTDYAKEATLIEKISESPYCDIQGNTNLVKKLVSLYLKNLLTLKNDTEKEEKEEKESAYITIVKALFNSSDIIPDAYKLQDENSQKKLLEIFYSASVEEAIATSKPQFHYSVMIANPETFKKFHSSLNKEMQSVLTKRLERSKNTLISSIQSGDFKSAIEIFMYHPTSFLTLYHNLEDEKTNPLTANQIMQFFSTLLNNKSTKGIEFGFSVIRACSESKNFMDANPDILTKLMVLFLKNAISVNKVKDACDLLSSKKSWDINVLQAYKECSIPMGSNKESSSIVNELTLEEEKWLLSLNDILEDPTKFSSFIIYLRKQIQDFYKTKNQYLPDKHPNLFKTGISQYLKKAIKLNRTKEVCDILSSNPFLNPYILGAYREQSSEDKIKLLHEFLQPSASKYNIELIGGLKESDSDLFDKISSSKSEETNKIIKNLLTIPVAARSRVSNIMGEFSLPFRAMSDYAAKLVCAETNQRKKYPFTPVVVPAAKFKEYLRLLKSQKPPVRERFIIDAEHWIAGEIEIPQNGVPRILFIDSLGSGEPKTHFLIKRQCSDVFDELIIYLSKEKRQHSNAGCTVFALKDVQDLFTIGNYLEHKYKGDIFKFVSDHIVSHKISSLDLGKKIIFEFPFPVYSCLLPLRFMRSEQSRSLLEKTIPARTKEEQSLPINKKRELVIGSSEKFFKTIKMKARNERLEYKFNKMAKNVFAYLAKHQFNFSQIDLEIEKFSLKGLKERFTVKNTVETLQSNATVTHKKDEDYKVLQDKMIPAAQANPPLSPQYFTSIKKVKDKESDEANAILIAVKEGSVNSVKELLAKSDPNSLTSEQLTALIKSAEEIQNASDRAVITESLVEKLKSVMTQGNRQLPS